MSKLSFQHTDILGRPLKVGDKVLTKAKYSWIMGTLATITKINRVTITFSIISKEGVNYHRDPLLDHYVYEYFEDVTYTVRRSPSECVVINELLPVSQALANTYQQEIIDANPADFLPTKSITKNQYDNFRKSIYSKTWPLQDAASPIFCAYTAINKQLISAYPEYQI